MTDKKKHVSLYIKVAHMRNAKIQQKQQYRHIIYISEKQRNRKLQNVAYDNMRGGAAGLNCFR